MASSERHSEVDIGRTIEISTRSLMSGMIFSTARYSNADRSCFLCSYWGVPRSKPAGEHTSFIHCRRWLMGTYGMHSLQHC